MLNELGLRLTTKQQRVGDSSLRLAAKIGEESRSSLYTFSVSALLKSKMDRALRFPMNCRVFMAAYILPQIILFKGSIDEEFDKEKR
jgi:hypothetical protein